ncbi:MAG: SIS domain-containing protein [Pseudomonadota bacterium]
MADDLFADELAEHLAVAEAVRSGLAAPFADMRALWRRTIEREGKIFFFGNGGSAADAQHLATELTIRYSRDRKPIAAIALTADSAALTAGGNDLGFERIFARQVEALGRPGDLALGLSTSGRSRNVLAALATARGLGLATAAFTGAGPHRLSELCDCVLAVPSTVTARIQEMHITLGQMLCAALERDLGLV